MCGIVGIAGNLKLGDEALFTNLLFADTLRGSHATGVALVKGQCREITTFKGAYSAPIFLGLQETANVLQNFMQNTVALGHNRHATKGSASDHKGAHPFVSDHITLVHNGSLTTHAALTTETFVVDSAAICKAISVEGAANVLPKLSGAYALVWIDSNLNTLNFARNSERPLFLNKDHFSGSLCWASEEGMLNWLIARNKHSVSSTIGRSTQELPEGIWRQYPITHIGIDLDEEVNTPFEILESVRYTSWGGYSTSTFYSSSSSPSSSKHHIRNKSGKKHPTRLEAKGSTLPSLLTPLDDKEEDALCNQSNMRLTQAGKQELVYRNYIEQVDLLPNGVVLEGRLAFTLDKFEAYTVGSRPYGMIKGLLLGAPHTPIVVHGYTLAEYNLLVKESPLGLTGYIAALSLEQEEVVLLMDRNNLSLMDPLIYNEDNEYLDSYTQEELLLLTA